MRKGIVWGLPAVVAAVLSAAPVEAGDGSRACGREDSDDSERLEVVGLTDDQRLICFREGAPSKAFDIGAVTGLTGDTRLVGIDFRPATGELYGLGDAGGVYTLDTGTAEATFKSQLNVALSGAFFGVDFNPTVDRLRIVSDTGQNLRANVDTGATTVDGSLAYPPPATGVALGVTGAAYTNNDATPDTATTLFDIDSTLDQVVVQAPPNAGTLNPTGKLTVDAGAAVGFDIHSELRAGRTVDNSAFASLVVDGKARFYRINLLTGRASLRGTFKDRNQVIDVALPLDQS